MKIPFSRKNLASYIGAAVTMAIVAIPDAIASTKAAIQAAEAWLEVDLD